MTCDPLFSSVVLLLHCDGTNGSTSIVDSSLAANTMTAFNGADISTADPMFGTGALNLPGIATSGDTFVSTPLVTSAPLDILTGDNDFTIEGWFNLSATNTDSSLVFDYGADHGILTHEPGFHLFATQGGSSALVVQSSIAGWNQISFPTPGLVAGTWYSFALVRISGTVTLYLNGVPASSATQVWTGFPGFGATPFFTIGYSGSTQGGINPYQLDEFRITKGTGRYTGAYTPAGPFLGLCAPTITNEPQNTTSYVGSTATFLVTAVASGGTLSYQWYLNGTLISGATSSTYTTPALLQLDDGDSFTVVVTDEFSSVTSTAAILTVQQFKVAGKFVPALVFKANQQANVGDIEPKIWRPLSNRTFRG